MAFEIVENTPSSLAVIKVIGVGGGGGNAVAHMVANRIQDVEFICANTDAQALKNIDKQVSGILRKQKAVETARQNSQSAPTDSVLEMSRVQLKDEEAQAEEDASFVSDTPIIKIQLGGDITKGLGAGANPEVGRQSALEDREVIADILQGADMVFITAGMGGGTGTGAAPVVAEVASELGILSVAVVTKPFNNEGPKRMRLAEEGIAELTKHVDSLVVIPNQRLREVLPKGITLKGAFAKANDVLLGAVKGIADVITHPGEMNVDFADVRTVMSEMGTAMMGAGAASGEQRHLQAAEQAIRSPLLEDIDLKGAKGILVNITANADLELEEFDEVIALMYEHADEDATIIVGNTVDASLGDELRVTVIATGLENKQKAAAKVEAEQPTSRASKRASLSEAAIAGGAQVARQANVRAHATPSGDQASMLDIPTFLRKQAD
ncbi:cell division protein FtsZ [Marinospirillum sp.]|uniref:cell division protein FtsZ n=1 Tax=Marinospirillum sp. TaxID=2183934 RepID=UPI0028700C9E|nr:cell division protein FtsZ [Marinospirillum sp.]MDR9469352.1 cell division protein FtsZ [Marinospirillum sp.]